MNLPPGIRTTLRWSSERDAAVDVALMLGVAAVTIAAVSNASEPGQQPVAPIAVGYVLAALIGAVLLARRRAPLGVLLVSAALLFIYYALLPGISPALPLSVALYTASSAGRIRWSLSIGAFFVLTGILILTVHRHHDVLTVLTDASQQAGLLVAVILLGEAIRSRRGWLVEVRRRLARAEAEREQEAARRVVDERMRIARELHDVLAHTISVITVQAGVAADVLDGAEPEARAALATIRTASREATTELRATLGVLREGDHRVPRMPAPGLDQLPDLLDRARGTGLAVSADIAGDPRPLPSAVELTAYRIVQESLTNVIRHANASTATVSLRYGASALCISVRDDGRGAPDSSPDGNGLTGMRERTAALDGTVRTGSRSGSGFEVDATLPI